MKHLEEVKLKKIELLKENIRYVNDQQILDGIYREISNCYFEISNSYYYKLTDVNNKNRIRKYRMKDLIKKLLQLPYCTYERGYKSDNLYHDVLNLYY